MGKFERLLASVALLVVAAGCAGRDEVSDWFDANYAHPMPGVRRSTNGTLTLRHVRGDRRVRVRDGVHTVRVSPDGESILAVCGGGTARIWESVSGRQRAHLRVPEGAVYGVEFSADGSAVIALGHPGSHGISEWDAETGKRILAIDAPVPGTQFGALAVSDRLIAGIADKAVEVWDRETGKRRSRLKLHGGYGAWDVALSSDGRYLASVGNSDDLVIWDTAERREVRRVSGVWGPNNELLSLRGFDEIVEISPDDREVLVSSQDGPLHRWTLVDGKPLPRLLGLEHPASDVRFSRDGRLIAALGFSGRLILWNRKSGERIREVAPMHRGVESDECADCFDLGPDGSWFVTGGSDGALRRWSTASDRELPPRVGRGLGRRHTLVPNSDRMISIELERVRVHERISNKMVVDLGARGMLHRGATWDALVASDGSTLLTSGGDGTVRLADLVDGKARAWWKRREGSLDTVWFANCGRTCVESVGDGAVQTWSAEKGASPCQIFCESSDIRCVGVTSIADLIAYQLCPRRTEGGSIGKTDVVVRRLGDGAELWRLRRVRTSVERLVFSEDGTQLLELGERMVVRDALTGESLVELHGDASTCTDVLWSSEGNWIYGLSGSRLVVWDARDGKRVDSIRALDWASFIGADGPMIWMDHCDGTVAAYEHRPIRR